MNGDEVFREMTAIRPDVRVILSSGYTELGASSHFPDKAPAAFVQKPFTVDELVKTLRRVLET